MSDTRSHTKTASIAELFGSEGAFPNQPLGTDGLPQAQLTVGLTKREWLIGMAMNGLCAQGIPGRHNRPENVAREAVEIADQVLALLSDEVKP